MENIDTYPVKSQVSPGEIYNSLPGSPPADPEEFNRIMDDFNKLIMPGLTHWQHPSFFAYFPANSSPPSVLAEMLTSSLAAQCMIWETSPAAAELEEKMMNWLRDMTGLPAGFEGVIQDTASTATLASIITAREKSTSFEINSDGKSRQTLRVYCSGQTHSSVEKAVKIAGMGRKNLVKVDVREDYSMDPDKLRAAISSDISRGFLPSCVVATLGTTGTAAVDPLRAIGEICREFGIFLHVDAAMAGTALILPEFRWMIDGIEYADSFVFNPHKWMFTNFDCTAYYVRDASLLIRTFEILPEYLKTRTRGIVNDYRDWGVPLGRRFRALKLWFVIRSYGLSGLQEIVMSHVRIAAGLRTAIENEADFELMAPGSLPVVCFRYNPGGLDNDKLNSLNQTLNHSLNDSGKMYLTHTSLSGRYTLRMVTAQTNVTESHVMRAWEQIKSTARSLKA